MSYRDDALAQLDVLKFLSSQGTSPGAIVGPNEVRITCPFHPDEHPSANINVKTGLWHCKTCDAGGSPIDWLMKGGASYKEALTEVGRLAGLQPPSSARHTNGAAGSPLPAASSPSSVTKTKLTEANVKAWFEAGLRNVDLQRWFHDHRGYSPETIARFELGWDGQRVTIPVRDGAGKLVNVRRYQRNSTSEQQKMLPLMVGAGPDVSTRLFPDAEPLPTDVLLVEGEWDAMICRQHGLEGAMTVTIGAGMWNPSLTPRFEGRTVTIAYDNDPAGQKGAVRVAKILSAVATVKILTIPNLPPKGDPTEFFVEQQRSVDELRQLIADAPPYIVASAVVDEPEARKVALANASDAALRGVRLELPVLMSGKAMTPYTVPYEFNVHCDMSNKRFCAICPMQEVSGNRDVVLTAADPAVLSLIAVSSQQQYEAIKVLAKAVHQCNRPQVEVKKAINIEELRLIPELDDATNAAGDVEYVSRQGFFMGHGLLPNRSYAMRGYSHPHPKTQATVHLLSEAEPAQDNISAFALTPELRDQLKAFQSVDVDRKWRDIYADFASSVHRIQDRFDMQVAFDLVWYSAIAFYFNGAFVRRGWVEAMVMSDSGQGKSEMTTNLLHHYGLGHRLPAEQTSQAGLIGGLEKMGDTWLLGWGAIPLNDKRLLVIDEVQGLAPAAIEAMSDVRASGVAEITKIRTERTNARCRIAWLANPVTGLTIAQHNQGVLAIKELFKKPEDVRRLDFGLVLASGDVDFASSINVRHDDAGEPRYSSALCRSLVLWAWSRRPDQVEFTKEATDAILAAATDMGRRYHASIPLVEPSDQRLKLARLAAAAAARVYSTDETGERLIVGPAHVAFVVDYLERIYNSRAMAYGEFSDSIRRGEALSSDDDLVVRDELSRWINAGEAIELLRTATIFKKSDLIDGVGWDDDYAKAQLRFLRGKRLIGNTRLGMFKTPAFITLLRAMTGVEVSGSASLPEPDGEDVPF